MACCQCNLAACLLWLANLPEAAPCTRALCTGSRARHVSRQARICQPLRAAWAFRPTVFTPCTSRVFGEVLTPTHPRSVKPTALGVQRKFGTHRRQPWRPANAAALAVQVLCAGLLPSGHGLQVFPWRRPWQQHQQQRGRAAACCGPRQPRQHALRPLCSRQVQGRRSVPVQPQHQNERERHEQEPVPQVSASRSVARARGR